MVLSRLRLIPIRSIKRKAFAAGLCFAVILLMTGCYSVEQSTVERGYRWIKRGQTDQAISTFQYALRKYPESVMAQVGLGDALFEANQDQAAIEAYTLAIARLETDRPASKKRGDAEIVGNPIVSYQNQGLRFPAGLEAYLSLRRGLAYQGLARMTSGSDQAAAIQDAAANYDAALQLSPAYAAAREARESLSKLPKAPSQIPP